MAEMLERPYKPHLYRQMASTWKDYGSGRLSIRLQDCNETFLLPLAFVAGSGNNTLHFVQELIQHMVNEPGHISNLSELGLTLEDAPVSEMQILFASDTPDIPFTWAKGPDGRQAHRAPGSEDSFDDTESLSSSRITSLQVLSMALLAWHL
jgi:hypothetical protein